MWSPWQPPRPIAQLSTKRFLRELLRRSHASRQELVTAATEVVGPYIRKDTYLASLQAFLNVCCTINDVKIRAFGFAGVSHVANELMRIMGDIWIHGAVFTPGEYDMLNALAQRLRVAGEMSWYFPKLRNLLISMWSKIYTESFASTVAIDPNDLATYEAFLRTFQGGSLDNVIDLVVDALNEHRKYGVKPSFFQDGVFHDPDMAWVVLNTDEIRTQEFDPMGLADNLFAMITLTDRDEIRSLGLDIVEEHSPEGFATRSLGTRLTDSVFDWYINRSGQITLDRSGVMPIRDIFEAQGKLGEYRLLRLAHTLHLYDLTVPITVVRQMPTLPQAGSLQMTQGNPIRQLLDPKLILPRIKELFQNRAALQRALEQEIEEANTDTRRRRSPQRHECTGHARLLPPGKRASASARALAAHEGINLAPNETYVSKHKRGRGQTLVGPHEAVRR